MVNYKRLPAFVLFCLFAFSCQRPAPITLETLLDEMVSYESFAKFPDPYFTCRQASSYDRRSIHPDSAFWCGNNDGYVGGNFDRVDTINGRIEKVMLDHQGPGVITRMWITSLDQRPVIRFYFDGADEAQFNIPAYDLTQIGIEGVGTGLVIPHTSYSKGQVGGSTSYFPIPYAKSCKITVEIPMDIDKNPRYYQINYRSYDKNVEIETFSYDQAIIAKEKIEQVSRLLLNPPDPESDYTYTKERSQLFAGDSILAGLPIGSFEITDMIFKIDLADSANFGQIMRELILSANFDGIETVRIPLGDFTGGGMGAFPVESWLLESDGKGSLRSRWPMPYKKAAEIGLVNNSGINLNVSLKIMLKEKKWDKQALYFHAAWKQNNDLQLFHCNDDINNPDIYAFNMATISGKGVFRGDVMSLYNYSESWYGEGDEKIWIDNESFPSHIGTGTEDYYNSSWAPVVLFQTPFGGAIRADSTNSRGYNTWLRTRNLDGIPFKEKIKFDFELLSWFRGKADYSSTVYWYQE